MLKSIILLANDNVIGYAKRDKSKLGDSNYQNLSYKADYTYKK